MKKTGNNGNANNGSDDKNLSALYGKLSTEMPASKLDDAILSAAHQNIKPGKIKKISTSPFSSNWAVPLSLAATVVLSVSIILTIPDADIQNQSELQMRQLDKAIPEAIEAEKPAQMNQAIQLKPAADRKQAGVQSLEAKEEKRGPQLLRKESAKQKPAMAPAERSAPASVAPLRSLEEADTATTLTNQPDVAPASTREVNRARSVTPKKAAKKNKIKTMATERPAKTKKTFANISKVVPGLNKQTVFELLGEPDKKTETSWLYRIVENSQAQNYTITFENNQVMTVEMIAPALKQ